MSSPTIAEIDQKKINNFAHQYYRPYLNQFLSRDPFPGYGKLPQSQNGYSYSHNNPVNYTDPSGKIVDVGGNTGGGCSHTSTSCEQFIAEVEYIIESLKQERDCNPLLKIIDEDALALDVLAAYYSGIPFNMGPLYTGFIPRQSIFQPGTPDRRQVPPIPWAPDAGFEWDHPINQHHNRNPAFNQNNIDIGESLRQDYGFKRPFYDQTHHYFAFLKFAFRGGIMFPLGTDRLISDNLLWTYHKNQEIKGQLAGLGAYDEWKADPDNPALRQRYAWLYQESVRDLYIMDLALEDARAIRAHGIDILPNRLRLWCAANEADVWSLEDEVNQYYFEFPQQYWPAEDFWPNQ